MKVVTQCYRDKLENVRDNDIDHMIKSFQSEMKQRYIVHPSMVEKYKDDISFMVEIDNTWIEEVEPRIKFIEPIGYEMIVELIEGCVYIILESKKEMDFPRWGTYEEKVLELHYEFQIKERKKNVEKKIDSILKESSMTRDEFSQLKGIAMEMNASGQSEVIATTPIIVVAPFKGVTIAQPCV